MHIILTALAFPYKAPCPLITRTKVLTTWIFGQLMKTPIMTLSEILTRLMFDKRIRTAELARRTNLPQPTVQRIVSGVTPNPHRSSLEPIAQFFELTLDQLKGLEPIPGLQPATPEAAGWQKIPLLEWDQTNDWLAGNLDLKNFPDLFTDAKVGPRAYALNMKDSSMEPQFPKNTTLIVDPDKAPKDRDFVIAHLQNYPEAVFRQLLMDGPQHYLRPLSPDFQHFKVHSLEKHDKIIGVLAQVRRDFTE